MSEITQVLRAAGCRKRPASAELLPLVYDELRRIAAARMALSKYLNWDVYYHE